MKKASELTHYRTPDSTYLSTRLWETDFIGLTAEDQAMYLRMLTWPYHSREVGVDVSAVLDETADDEAEANMKKLCERLEAAGLIVMNGATATFPNVVYGEPPCHSPLGPGEYCADCGTINPEEG